MSENKTVQTINLGDIVISATINGKPANLIAAPDLQVVVSGTINVNLPQ
jgi:hypothetical protein